MLDIALSGIHHVTAICGDPQRNIDFYTGILGLRLVKVTVNFDDPSSYHFYYGDATGSPGTLLTFFAWPNSQTGIHAAPQATAVAFVTSKNSVGDWKTYLEKHGVAVSDIQVRFGQQLISFSDPDGLTIEIIEDSTPEHSKAFAESGLPETTLLYGIHSVTLTEHNDDLTLKYLSEVMGLTEIGHENGRTRMSLGDSSAGRYVDVVVDTSQARGRIARGNIHHVAFRTPNQDEQLLWKERVKSYGAHVSDVMERCYFQSIYYREPGGVLFEIATDTPGMEFDQSYQKLGTALCLPPWLEVNRTAIEQIVVPITYPEPLSEN